MPVWGGTAWVAIDYLAVRPKIGAFQRPAALVRALPPRKKVRVRAIGSALLHLS
jgi:hypothetical protein